MRTSGRRLLASVGIATLFSVCAAGPANAAPATEAEPIGLAASNAPSEPPGSTAEPVAVDPNGNGNDQWVLTSTPYLWISGMKGDVAVSSDLPTIPIDWSFGEILDMFKFGLMGAGGARRNRFVAEYDFMFMNLGASKDIGIRDPDFLTAKVGSKMFVLTGVAGYRAVDDKSLSVDVLGGGRFTYMKTSLDLEGPNRSHEGSTAETWIDPIVAMRLKGNLGGKWGYSAYGDIGGFGIVSHITWQALGQIDYRIGKNAELSAGWRHLEVDYSNKSGFLMDAAMDGPIISATFRM